MPLTWEDKGAGTAANWTTFAQWSGYQSDPDHPPTIVADTDFSVGKARQHTLVAGDVDPVTGSHRTEMLRMRNPTQGSSDFVSGSLWFIGFELKIVSLDVNSPGGGAGFQVGLQGKQEGTGTPPFDLALQEGVLMVAGTTSGGVNWKKTLMANPPLGQRISGILEVKWSSDPAVGYVRAWCVLGTALMQEAAPTLAKFATPTMIPGISNYLKSGLYAATSQNGTLRWYLRAGTDFASVAPPDMVGGTGTGGGVTPTPTTEQLSAIDTDLHGWDTDFPTVI